MKTISLWESITADHSDYPVLSKDIEVDVAIVGGGITGVTAAAHLIQAGKKVAIIEANKIGGVTTRRSTGNLYIPVQPFYQNIQNKFDFTTTQAIAQSRKFAIDYIEKMIKEKNIQCQFARRPWYGYTANHERISLEKEVELFKKIEIPIEYVDELPLPFKFKKAVSIPDQARFNPFQYIVSLARDLAEKNCLIFEKTRITDIQEKEFCTLTTANAKITAKKVLLATHTPIGIHSKQFFTAPYRSYVVCVSLKENNYPEGHFWDLDRPPHSTCTHPISGNTPELIMVAGSHHKVGQQKNTLASYEALEKFLKNHFPVSKIEYQWSAQHYQSADNVPYIGLASRFAKHTYLATGFFADGLVYGTLAGLIFGDAILKNKNSFSDVYQSKRFDPVASFAFIFKENANVFFQYLKDYPFFNQQNYEDIRRGEGKVLQINFEKYAVSRDEKDKLHIVSAVCPHMKCIVNWNHAEKTWDCPCHGSRFTQCGKVIEGPAQSDLQKKLN